MMSQEIIFNKINNLLSDAGYTAKVNGLSDVKAFINNKENEKLEVYDKIEEMYDAFMLGQGMW